MLADHESSNKQGGSGRVEVAELRMLRWTCGKTMVDMIPNGVFRAELDVDSIIDKMREGRLRWFGHVKRRSETAPVRRVEAMLVEGSRRRARPKLRWEDRLKQDMTELLLSEDMTSDRNAWRDRIRISGYAIGGLAGGEDKDSFWRVVAQCTASLPESKPRYVMGVGYPLDIVVCSALGADMYDCVYPTRTARFGTALVPEGVLRLKHQSMADDTRPIDSTCECMVCKNYTRAYLHCLVTKEAMGSQLLSYHNLHYMLQLSRNLHSSIIEGTFPEFVCNFLMKMVRLHSNLVQSRFTTVFAFIYA
ncbi:queuine tRNA-ribosyltransferase catalytic subunit 1-like protein [Tanacetum coccineum]